MEVEKDGVGKYAKSFDQDIFSQAFSLSFWEFVTDQSQSKQNRKYLGDPSDPHYVPKSPLIERRKLSTQDEAELKRICSLALSEVPHSDEMMDDPFRYLASHITVSAPTKPPRSQSQPVVNQEPAPQVAKPAFQMSSSTSTATPSDTSKRETLQTNVTTPMTTPGVTPGDTDKRFSDGVKGPQGSQPSISKTETKPAKHAVYSFLKDPLPYTRPQFSATKSLTHLPNLSKNKSKNKTPNLPTQMGKTIITNPDFNKSLPAIPHLLADASERVVEVEPTPKEKSNGITRMFRTVRLMRAQTAHELTTRGTSSDQHERLGTLNKFQSINSPRKQKFSFASIFHKRPANNKRATVG